MGVLPVLLSAPHSIVHPPLNSLWLHSNEPQLHIMAYRTLHVLAPGYLPTYSLCSALLTSFLSPEHVRVLLSSSPCICCLSSYIYMEALQNFCMIWQAVFSRLLSVSIFFLLQLHRVALFPLLWFSSLLLFPFYLEHCLLSSGSVLFLHHYVCDLMIYLVLGLYSVGSIITEPP